jgi:hypothetical protein
VPPARSASGTKCLRHEVSLTQRREHVHHPFKPKPTKSFTLDNALAIELCTLGGGIWRVFINDIVVWNGGGTGVGTEEIEKITRKDYEGLDGLKLFCQKVEEQMSILVLNIKESTNELVRVSPIKANALHLLDKANALHLLESLSSK